ncbi:MAG: ABC transporter permease subunit [Infirmifilum uzonense]
MDSVPLYTMLLAAATASLFRMLAAYVLSVLTALLIGSAMAKNKTVESILLPILDILQSIPILGFFPAALILFVTYFPERIGVELASVFLIWTSLVWNMIFGVYSSVKSLDPSYNDLVKAYNFGHAARFFFIYAPVSRRSLIANSLVSWAGGWFFLTSAEVVSLGSSEYRVTGLGSFIIEQFNSGNLLGFYLGVALLLLIITLTYFLIWNPAASKNLGLNLPSFTAVYDKIHDIVAATWGELGELSLVVEKRLKKFEKILGFLIRLSILVALVIFALNIIAGLGSIGLPNFLPKMLAVLYEIPITLSRIVFILLLSLSLSLLVAFISYRSVLLGGALSIIGEILASIPAIIWWPLLAAIALRYSYGAYIVSLIVFLQGSFWYLYFNIIVYGLSSIRKDLEELSSVYKIRGVPFIRYVFVPSLLPSIATGALSAWGGAWNASVVAEYVVVGDHSIDIGGVGALLNRLAIQGDAEGLVVSALLLSSVIVLINKTLWSRFFKYIEGKYGGED